MNKKKSSSHFEKDDQKAFEPHRVWMAGGSRQRKLENNRDERNKNNKGQEKKLFKVKNLEQQRKKSQTGGFQVKVSFNLLLKKEQINLINK